MKYHVHVKYLDGTLALLTHRNRTLWAIRTARKHLRDCQRNIATGQWPGVAFVWIVPVSRLIP